MKIGIYGGTFNPPHLGHLTSARFALEELKLDKLLFVPAALPPHKTLPGESASPQERWEMIYLAADSLLLPGRVEACDLEMHRTGKSYTSDTLAQLREQYPEDELWLLMGSDMFLTLPSWHEPERILSLAGAAAFARTQSDEGARLDAQVRYLRETYGAKVQVIPLPRITEVSSTALRDLLAAGDASAAEYLPPAVYGYILMHGLYGTHADRKHLPDRELRACSYSMIRAKRIAHVQGTEQEAERLAIRWGADPVKARRAGILHDCTKYLSLEEQLALCDQYGIELDELERIAVKLLHSKTGAAIARDVFGVDDDIFWAIFWHTTGKADMKLLEKILYIADYMEPTRDFPGVERLRELAYRDLDAALLLGFEMSVQEMADRGLQVHHNTLEARDFLRAQGVRLPEER